MKPHLLGVALAAAAALALAGCSRGTPAVTEPVVPTGVNVGTGIAGLVTEGPMCPVEPADGSCPDRPISATIDIQDVNGRLVKEVRSGSDGIYRLPVDPGVYRVVPGKAGALFPRPPAPVTVTVPPGLWVRADLSYDTGIR